MTELSRPFFTLVFVSDSYYLPDVLQLQSLRGSQEIAAIGTDI
jgi:hypothetical protein